MVNIARLGDPRAANEALYGVAAGPAIATDNIQHLKVSQAVATVIDTGVEPHVHATGSRSNRARVE
jgi:hypothetical protein